MSSNKNIFLSNIAKKYMSLCYNDTTSSNMWNKITLLIVQAKQDNENSKDLH